MKSRLLLFLTFLLSFAAYGQTGLATITGTVSDQTGAVIANAPIEARHIDTGSTFSAISTSTGNYTIQQLPIGRYEVTVSMSGFKTYSHQNLTLAAAQVLREDIALEVGATTDSVTVTAEASLLKTESGQVTHNVTVSQLQNLPIIPVNGATGSRSSNGFRDPFAVALVIPGVQYDASTTMVVNGTPNTTMQIRVEGQTAGNTGGLAVYTHMTQPSVDAIEEVAVQTSNFAAEYGTVGGAIFNVTMKSGTNTFHGSAYDYIANEALNSSNSYTHLKTRERRHDYGFTFGGPVRIPGVYDGKNKTFFFWSLERFYNKSIVTTTTATVPTAQYRGGDFAQVILGSGVNGVPRPLTVGTGAAQRNYVDPLGRTNISSGAIFDPLSTRPITCSAAVSLDCTAGATVQVRDAYVGNRIPVSLLDPVSAKVQSLVPLPVGVNAAAGQYGANFQNPWQSDRSSNLPSIKADQNIGGAGRLSFYWSSTATTSQYAFPNGNAEGFPTPITGARGSFVKSYTSRLNYDHTLTPTILLHFGIGWSQQNFNDASPTTNYNPETELGLKGARLNRNFPNFNTCGVAACTAATGGMSTLGPSGGIQGTGGSERRPSAVTSFSWVRSNHTIKGGAEWRLEMYPVAQLTNAAGSYNFSGNGATVQTALQGVNLSQGSTGFGYANFFLGGATAVTLAQPAYYRTSKQQWGIYLQDTWKLTRKLTVDYGVRWDYGTYSREDHGRNGNLNLFVPNASAGGHPGGVVFEANCNCSFAANYAYSIGPRFGFAYQLNQKTVFRGGFGVVYTPTGNFAGSVTNSAASGTLGFGDTLFQLKDGIPSSINPQWPVYLSNVGQANNAIITAPGMLDRNGGRPARQYQWSIGLQREINKDLVVEASYVANRGTWWSQGNALTSMNDLSTAALGTYGFQVGPNATADRGLLLTQIGNLTAAQRSQLAARGVNVPWSGYPTTQTVRQSIRQFPQYSNSINPSLAPLGNTWYDSLQVTLTKRYSHGLTLNANYTFSKTLDLFSSPDIFNRSIGKNYSPNDLPHQFRLSAEYQVPRIKDGVPVLGNRVVSYILGNWGVGVYLQYQSGVAIDRPSSPNTAPITDWFGRGQLRAQLKDGMSPWAVNWTDYDGKVHTEALDVNCHCYDPAKTVVLNPNAWEAVPNGQWAPNINQIRDYRSPRRPSESMNLSRNFRFKEGRILLHVRTEFANVFNRTLLPSLATTSGNTNFTAVPTVQNGVYTGGFGTYGNLTGGAGLGAGRTGQLIGRLTF